MNGPAPVCPSALRGPKTTTGIVISHMTSPANPFWNGDAHCVQLVRRRTTRNTLEITLSEQNRKRATRACARAMAMRGLIGTCSDSPLQRRERAPRGAPVRVGRARSRRLRCLVVGFLPLSEVPPSSLRARSARVENVSNLRAAPPWPQLPSRSRSRDARIGDPLALCPVFYVAMEIGPSITRGHRPATTSSALAIDNTTCDVMANNTICDVIPTQPRVAPLEVMYA